MLDQELRKETKTKYIYKVNNNLSYGFLKDRIICFICLRKKIKKQIMDQDRIIYELNKNT
jgi:hypothetical protein